MKIAVILLPDSDIPNAKVQFLNMNDTEKEQVFDLLDAELHDTTYQQLDDMVSQLRHRNEELQESLDYFEEVTSEVSECKKVTGY